MSDSGYWSTCWLAGCTAKVDPNPEALGCCKSCAEWLRDETATMADRPAKRMAWSEVLG